MSGPYLRERAEDTTAVSYVELFFDLVFVFAVTQISHLLLHDLSPHGAFRAALVLDVQEGVGDTADAGRIVGGLSAAAGGIAVKKASIHRKAWVIRGPHHVTLGRRAFSRSDPARARRRRNTEGEDDVPETHPGARPRRMARILVLAGPAA